MFSRVLMDTSKPRVHIEKKNWRRFGSDIRNFGLKNAIWDPSMVRDSVEKQALGLFGKNLKQIGEIGPADSYFYWKGKKKKKKER